MAAVDWLVLELRKRGIKHVALGAHMGWSDSQTSKALSGSRELKADELLEAMRFLGVPSPIGEDNEHQEAARHLAALRPDQRAALLAFARAMRAPAPGAPEEVPPAPHVSARRRRERPAKG